MSLVFEIILFGFAIPVIFGIFVVELDHIFEVLAEVIRKNLPNES